MKDSDCKFIQGVSNSIRFLFPFVNPDVADFIACQSACETSYGRSYIYQENHNLFGMKVAKFRISCCLGENRNHAKYVDFNQSIYDYFLWLSFNDLVQEDLRSNLDHFIARFPWSSYCPTDGYLSTISSIYKSFKFYFYE